MPKELTSHKMFINDTLECCSSSCFMGSAKPVLAYLLFGGQLYRGVIVTYYIVLHEKKSSDSKKRI